MLQPALALLGVLAMFAAAVRAVGRVANPVDVLAGVGAGLLVLGATLVALGPEALFWSPWFLAEGFAMGYAVAWCVRRIYSWAAGASKKSS